jgi:hypothetical protein
MEYRMSTVVDIEQTKKEWLSRLASLVKEVRTWAEEIDWSTREIEITLPDSLLGKHKVPALLLQKEATKVLLEPITRQAPGADAVVDLYLMPGYDDIATVYHCDNAWRLRYTFSNDVSSHNRDAEDFPLSKEVFEKAIEDMVRHVA